VEGRFVDSHEFVVSTFEVCIQGADNGMLHYQNVLYQIVRYIAVEVGELFFLMVFVKQA